jgi:hypothetical protein
VCPHVLTRPAAPQHADFLALVLGWHVLLRQVSLHGLSHSSTSCILSMFIQRFCVACLFLVCIAHGIAALEVSTKTLRLMSSMPRARLISRLARVPHIANGTPTQPPGKNNNKKRETKQVGKIRKVFAARSMPSPEHRRNCRLQGGRGTRACSASLVRAHSYKCHSPSRAWIGLLTRNSPLDGDGRASQVFPVVNLHGIRLHHCLLRNQIEITTVSQRSTF